MNLLEEVKEGLSKRKGQWKEIAAAVPEVSYSWVAQVGRGKYASEPTYNRLEAVAKHLRSLSKLDGKHG